jgi:nucleoside-diphosphate-sugar epimerase
MKNILVTGGTGFIGSNIVNRLVNKGYNVSVLDNNQRGFSSRLRKNIKKIKVYIGDIRDKKIVSQACKNIHTVVHLAYVNGTKFFYQKPDLILDIAIRGMLNISDACKEKKVKDFILFSSSEVYSNPDIIPTSENISLKIPDINNPRYSYGGGKICCELILKYMFKNFFRRSMIIRPHNVYGPDMGNEHFFPEIIKKIILLSKNRQLMIQGSGNETRSFVHINDFLEGFELVLKKGKNNEIYNIGTESEFKIIEVIKKMQKIIGKKNKIIPGQIRSGSPLRRCPSIEKIKKLGYKPKIDIEKGLLEVCRWYSK